MARYFMGDTRLAGLEWIMMDSTRSVRADTRGKIPQKKLPYNWSAKAVRISPEEG